MKQKHIASNTLTLCVSCEPCGSACSFLDNKIIFVADSKHRRISKLSFDTSLAVCRGQCKKECITDLRLVKLLEPKVYTTTK